MKRYILPLRLSVLMILLGAVLLYPASSASGGTILHVTPNGQESGDCSDNSWVSACSLQYALSIAKPGDEIWVAGGTYRPSTTGDKEMSFALEDGVAVYGGFAGSESRREDRRWAVYISTLSGDLLGNDAGTARWDNPTFSDNSYHVVTAEGAGRSTVLDGFTIRGGNAEGGFFGDEPLSGGGVSLVSGSPVLSNLIIAGNTVNTGANGGGLYADRNSNPDLTNILFSGNTAGQQGGAIYNSMGQLVLTNVTLAGNEAVNSGGAIFTFMGSVLVRNSIIWGNDSPFNPSMMISLSTVTLSNTDVEGGCPSSAACDITDRYDDPNFINPAGADGIFGTHDDNARLDETSPLINKGSNSVTDPALPSTDLDGLPRIIQETVDMGAYEQQFSSPPVSADQIFHAITGYPFSGQLKASDPDGDPLQFQLFGDIPVGSLGLQEDGRFTYTPPPVFVGIVRFQFLVTDGITAPVGPYTATIFVQYAVFLPHIRK